MISRLFILTCLLTVITAANMNETSHLPYQDARKYIIQAEDFLATGGNLHLNSRETIANDIFMKHKYDELERGFDYPETDNAASMHFFKAKRLIDRSNIFKFLQKMPKGAVLHAHTSATVSSKWVVKNIFYLPGLLKCTSKDGVVILSFRKEPDHGCGLNYVRVSDERQNASSIAMYDRALERLINLYTATPEMKHSSTNKIWTQFENMFNTMSDVLLYLPAYRLYHWQMLEEFYNDNIMYAEVRLNFHKLYDMGGRIVYPSERSLVVLIDVVEKFKLQHPNFLGIKIIQAVGRKSTSDKIREHFELFKKLHYQRPDYLVGFDLVGQEDKGVALYNFVNVLHDKPTTSKFFFHAGETNGYGGSVDYNLIDALLLNTTRIGHGYALMKHPVLWNAVKTRDLAVEISPISNQVLGLVWDLRNHPGSFFISQNIPIVICNDDPGFWNAKGLSYDFFYAIMSLAPNNAGLKTLKQLVWNSIKYSSMRPNEQQEAYAVLQSQWDHFIDDVLRGFVV